MSLSPISFVCPPFLASLLPYPVRANPYCEVVVDGQKGNIRTDIKKKTSTPEWDEEFTMWVVDYCVRSQMLSFVSLPLLLPSSSSFLPSFILSVLPLLLPLSPPPFHRPPPLSLFPLLSLPPPLLSLTLLSFSPSPQPCDTDFKAGVQRHEPKDAVEHQFWLRYTGPCTNHPEPQWRR